MKVLYLAILSLLAADPSFASSIGNNEQSVSAGGKQIDYYCQLFSLCYFVAARCDGGLFVFVFLKKRSSPFLSPTIDNDVLSFFERDINNQFVHDLCF